MSFHRSRRQALVDALIACFGDSVEVLGAAAGLHLCARFPGTVFTPGLLEQLARSGVLVYPVEEHAIRKGRYRDTIIIGFGMLEPDRIRQGLEILRYGISGTRRPAPGCSGGRIAPIP